MSTNKIQAYFISGMAYILLGIMISVVITSPIWLVWLLYRFAKLLPW